MRLQAFTHGHGLVRTGVHTASTSSARIRGRVGKVAVDRVGAAVSAADGVGLAAVRGVAVAVVEAGNAYTARSAR